MGAAVPVRGHPPVQGPVHRPSASAPRGAERLADYEASVALSPNDPDLLAWRGICRTRLGRHDAAIADFTRVIALRPSEARGYRGRGHALERMGRHAEALRDFERASELAPER